MWIPLYYREDKNSLKAFQTNTRTKEKQRHSPGNSTQETHQLWEKLQQAFLKQFGLFLLILNVEGFDHFGKNAEMEKKFLTKFYKSLYIALEFSVFMMR